MIRKAYKPKQPHVTFATVAGNEVNDLHVFYDSWPEETYTAAGLEVTSVIEESECILHLMTEDEVEELEQRLHAQLCDAAHEHDEMRGDYLYDQMKDDRAENAHQ